MRTTRTFAITIIVSFCLASSATAQLPVATGRQISMTAPEWKIFIPSTYQQRPGNVADLLVHFHGDPQTYWNNAKYANLNTVIVTVNYNGLSSVYSTPFSNPALFGNLMNEALTKVRAEADFPDTLNWDKVGVSSFSAGFGAVREILQEAAYRGEIDSLLAADSLYATTAADGTPLDSQMVDYKTFATAAKNGTKTFIYSHSQVVTNVGTNPYESTYECADELMQHLGITPTAISANGLGTLNFYRKAQVGNFKLWGATGADGDSHLEHLRYIGEFLDDMSLATVQVPEPSSAMGVIVIAATTILRRRRRMGA
ncbi:MAG: hypothetical protein QOE14_2544 [Humisphaera sp.]|nr:hypothetical protein [Humisphaera sp.]